MPLLAEYGLVPDVFDTACYTSADLCEAHLQHLKEVMLDEGMVGNFRAGDWLRRFNNRQRPWHKRGQELLKKLATQNRLRLRPACLPNSPANDVDWCKEAVASHGAISLQGIVATDSTCGQIEAQPLVVPITRLSSAAWWTPRSSSVRLNRTLAAYRQHLGLVLTCSNSVMFIDPHLDPSQSRYRDFLGLLQVMAGRAPAPLIEIHRVCYFDARDKRNQHNEAGWRGSFASWVAPLRAAGLAVEVFIWDDFHDRYLISDLVGVSIPNGFDTTTDPSSSTTWTRLGRADRDDVQREFDPASGRHAKRWQFTLP